MKIFCKCPTVVICIAKNFLWTTLKAIFSIFRFFCTFRFQIFKLLYFSQIWNILTNNTSMESLFIHMMYKSQFKKKIPLWLVLWSRVTYFSVKVKKKKKYLLIIRLFKLYQSCVYWSLIGEGPSCPPHPRPVQTHLALNWWGGGAGWTMEDCQRRQQGTAWASPHWQPRPQRLNCFAGTN